MRLGWRVLLPLSLGNILITGFVILVMQSASEPLQAAFGAAADLTKAFIALGGLVGAVVAVRFLLSAPHHQRSDASSSARFAAASGGTHSAEMGA
jgi:NADH-quinone oxidoreductase subunit H